jgi:hypothetical protein
MIEYLKDKTVMIIQLKDWLKIDDLYDELKQEIEAL